MKTILLFTFFFYYSVSWAQFSESFFENLLPLDASRGHFGGCVTADNGVLGVRFAYQDTTEVQWVKLDQEGNHQYYAANLPQDSIFTWEIILDVFEQDSFQYIVTQDLTFIQGDRGFHIYKYQNYTDLVDIAFISKPIIFRKASAYLKFDKIHIISNQTDSTLIQLTIGTNDLIVQNDQILATSINRTSIGNIYFNENFIKFYDENNFDVYSRSDSNIVRIKMINSVLQTPEIFDLKVKRLLGFNREETKLLVLSKSDTRQISKYTLGTNLVYDSEVYMSNLTLNNSYNPVSNLQICSYQNKDFVYVKNEALYLCENNTLIDSNIYLFADYRVEKFVMNQGKICMIGSRIFRPYGSEQTHILAITNEEFIKVFNFKEYGGLYAFGEYNTHIGLGASIFDDIGFLRVDKTIFDSKIYFSGQYIAGKSGSNYYGSNDPYGRSEFKPGPYTNYPSYDVSVTDKYNENFYVTQQMLNEHVSAINNADPSYRMPKGIKNWPAHGDVSKGQAPNLAPFIDVNNNGMYEPLLGDFPSFPGTNCLLNITHQLESDNTGSGLEMHTYMYNFDCMDSIKDVIFIKTQVFNRGTIEFDSLAYGIYNDFDLGNYADDYIGTNVDNGLVYVYNGDAYDDDSGLGQGFRDSLPTMANMFLKGIPFSYNGLDDIEGVSEFQTINGFGFDDGVIDNEFKGLEYSFYYSSTGGEINGDPSSSQHFFSYLNGRWKNDENLYFGNTGIAGQNQVSTIKAKHMFPGNSDPNFYGTGGIDPGFIWDETTDNNPPGDRRIMGSFGSTPLAAGESITYHSAYLAGKRVPGMGQSEIDLFAKAAHVKKAFNANITSCGQTFDNLTEDQITSVPKKHKEIDFKIYPNPMEELVSIELSDEYASGKMTFVDINGKICLQAELKGKINSISVKDLPNGFYMVKIQSKQGTRQYKLVKK